MDNNNEIIARLERLENHFKVYKDDMSDVKDAIKDLKTAIVGSHINGNKGFIHLLDKISTKVDTIENENLLLKENMSLLKYISGSTVTALIGGLIVVFIKNR